MTSQSRELADLLQPIINDIQAAGWLSEQKNAKNFHLYVRNKAIKRLICRLRRETARPCQQQQELKKHLLRHLQRICPLAYESSSLSIQVEEQECTWSGAFTWGKADVRGSYIWTRDVAGVRIRLSRLRKNDDDDEGCLRCDTPRDAFKRICREELANIAPNLLAQFERDTTTVLMLETIDDGVAGILYALYNLPLIQAELEEVQRRGLALGFNFHWI